jgi:hypothetical protein
MPKTHVIVHAALSGAVLLFIALLRVVPAFAQNTPFIPDEWKFGRRQDSSALHYCVDQRDPDFPIARKIGAAIAGALLLQPKEHVIGDKIAGDDIDTASSSFPAPIQNGWCSRGPITARSTCWR